MGYPKVAGESVLFRENFLNRASVVANGGTNISANVSSISNGMTTTGGGVDYNLVDMEWFWENGGSIVIKGNFSSGASTSYERFVVWRISDDYSIDLARKPSNGDIACWIQTGPGNTEYIQSYSATADTDIYITITWNPANTTLSFYENAVLTGTDTTAGATSVNLDTNSRVLRLGNSSLGAGNNFTGTLYDVTIYNKVLSLAEITDIVNGTTISEVDASKSLVWLPCDTHYLDTTQKTENIGSLGGVVQVGDGSTSSTFPTVVENGFDFDGGDYYLFMADVSGIQNVFDGGGTVHWWMKADSDGENSGGRIFQKGTGWLVNVQSESAGKVSVRLYKYFDGADGEWNLTSAEVPLGQWVHFAIVYDADAVANNPTFYINGEERTVGSGITEATTPTGTRDTDVGSGLYIGNSPDGTRTFDGILDKVSVVGSVLTPTQIRYLYQKGRRMLGE